IFRAYDTPETFRLKVRDRDFSFFKKYVLEENGTLQVKKAFVTESQERMSKAIKKFQDKFKDETGKVDIGLLNKMVRFVLNNCMFVYVKTGTFTSAFRLFSVLNDRGMPLSNADLLKSMNLESIGDVERTHYQNIWETMEEELGREELEKLLGFIRLVYVKEKAKKTIQEEYNEKVFKDNLDFKGKKFIEYVKEFADIYREKVLNAELAAKDTDIKAKYYGLLTLMRDFIPGSDWVPVFIHFVQKFHDDEIVYPFLQLLERKFVTSWVKGMSPTARVTETVKMIHSIDLANSVEEVFEADSFKTEKSLSDFTYNINVQDFYKKKFAKYLLLRLDMNLSENATIKKAYSGIISVEHILPQTPPKGSEWERHFTAEDRKEWTHKLGNLVLLSRRKNSSANNKDFVFKLEKYFSNGITDFELTKELSNNKVWSITECEKRHELLVERLMSIYFR
ncbi:HNH endonuclease family protein, partial [Priestia flexa]|uniref:HNH endonuclease family protein n=1 Tax=Priestia flexa TaxID=86664 RepID=UPI002E1D4AF2|nr:HNH endonuclease family protein [Priestia flexa]